MSFYFVSSRLALCILRATVALPLLFTNRHCFCVFVSHICKQPLYFLLTRYAKLLQFALAAIWRLIRLGDGRWPTTLFTLHHRCCVLCVCESSIFAGFFFFFCALFKKYCKFATIWSNGQRYNKKQTNASFFFTRGGKTQIFCGVELPNHNKNKKDFFIFFSVSLPVLPTLEQTKKKKNKNQQMACIRTPLLEPCYEQRDESFLPAATDSQSSLAQSLSRQSAKIDLYSQTSLPLITAGTLPSLLEKDGNNGVSYLAAVDCGDNENKRRNVKSPSLALDAIFTTPEQRQQQQQQYHQQNALLTASLPHSPAPQQVSPTQFECKVCHDSWTYKMTETELAFTLGDNDADSNHNNNNSDSSNDNKDGNAQHHLTEHEFQCLRDSEWIWPCRCGPIHRGCLDQVRVEHMIRSSVTASLLALTHCNECAHPYKIDPSAHAIRRARQRRRQRQALDDQQQLQLSVSVSVPCDQGEKARSVTIKSVNKSTNNSTNSITVGQKEEREEDDDEKAEETKKQKTNKSVAHATIKVATSNATTVRDDSDGESHDANKYHSDSNKTTTAPVPVPRSWSSPTTATMAAKYYSFCAHDHVGLFLMIQFAIIALSTFAYGCDKSSRWIPSMFPRPLLFSSLPTVGAMELAVVYYAAGFTFLLAGGAIAYMLRQLLCVCRGYYCCFFPSSSPSTESFLKGEMAQRQHPSSAGLEETDIIMDLSETPSLPFVFHHDDVLTQQIRRRKRNFAALVAPAFDRNEKLHAAQMLAMTVDLVTMVCTSVIMVALGLHAFVLFVALYFQRATQQHAHRQWAHYEVRIYPVHNFGIGGASSLYFGADDIESL